MSGSGGAAEEPGRGDRDPASAPPRRWGRLAAGVLISAAALYVTLRDAEWDKVRLALAHLAWAWVPLMVVLKIGAVWLKGVRWEVELEAMAPLGPFRGTFRATALGYFGNVLLPFRLGELMRVGLLRRRNPAVDLGGALATIAAERALDGVVLALIVLAIVPFAEVPPALVGPVVALAAVMVGVVAVATLTPLHDLALRWCPSRGPLRFGRVVIEALSRGTAVLRRPRYLALATGYTIAAWLAEGLVVWAAVRALALPLGFADALVVTLLLSVALLVPSAPGQLGTHQLMTAWIVAPFGVATAAAVSLSIVMQAVALAVLGALGGWVVVTEPAGAARLAPEPAPDPDRR